MTRLRPPRRVFTSPAARGASAVRRSPGPAFVLRLPEAAHGWGFAVMSSFSGMLPAALATLAPGPQAALGSVRPHPAA